MCGPTKNTSKGVAAALASAAHFIRDPGSSWSQLKLAAYQRTTPVIFFLGAMNTPTKHRGMDVMNINQPVVAWNWEKYV